MAEVAKTGWTAAQTREQFAAIAWLRWRILCNSFRRKGGAGEMVGTVLLSVLFLGMVLFFVVGAGVAAYFLVLKGRQTWIAGLLWGIFFLCQLLNIQLGQPATTFDPTQLIRFPLKVNTYVEIRLFFGLLTPANVAGTFTSLAVAAGIGMAAPGLWLYALVAMAVFAATNVLFSRMIFAWVDRWLSTRRAREVFTGMIFAVSLGFQWANFTFNPAYNHNHKAHAYELSRERIAWVSHLYQQVHPWLAALPPELASNSVVKAKQAAIAGFAGDTFAGVLWGALFLLVFAVRMRTEFHGENLSDAASGAAQRPARTVKMSSVATAAPLAVVPSAVGEFEAASGSRIWAVIETVLGKEILYVRRNTGILYGLIMPIFLVLIFASKFASRAGSSSVWVFPAAVAYTLLAICPLSYNSLGLEAAGAQLYFIAPVRMRDILLAKNLLGIGMALVEVMLIFVIVSYTAGLPSLQMTLAAVFWAAGTLAVNMIFGNRRSIRAPKRIDSQRAMRRQASQASGLIAMAVMLITSGMAAGLFGLCFWLHQLWALLPLFAIYAAVGGGLYLQSLKSLDRYALDHREEMLTELCKQS
jgi:ABC-2 type transport system permease protein